MTSTREWTREDVVHLAVVCGAITELLKWTDNIGDLLSGLECLAGALNDIVQAKRGRLMGTRRKHQMEHPPYDPPELICVREIVEDGPAGCDCSRCVTEPHLPNIVARGTNRQVSPIGCRKNL
jgi:hypothetical protein